MSDAEQDPQIPTVQQDQVGRPAEQAEELRRAASSHAPGQSGETHESDVTDEAGAPSGSGDRVSAAEPAAAPTAPPGVFDRDVPDNLTTAEQESGQHDGEWEADASGTIQHTTGGAEGHPDDQRR